VNANQAERNEESECGFRAIRGGAKCIEAEDGNACNGANVLGAFLAGGQRPPKEKIQDLSGDCNRRLGGSQTAESKGKAARGILSCRGAGKHE
jgi:hypothetical protein